MTKLEILEKTDEDIEPIPPRTLRLWASENTVALVAESRDSIPFIFPMSLNEAEGLYEALAIMFGGWDD